MYNREVWEATPAKTLLHNLDARAKAALLVAVAVLAISLDSPRSLFILFCFTLVLHFIACASFARWRALILLVLFGIWGSMTSQALFYSQEPRTVIACLVNPSAPVIGELTGGVFIYQEGLKYGATQALRSVIMLSTGLLVSWTTDPRQLLRSLLAWKFPYELAFMLITGLRFLPVIVQETTTVLTAQRLRGFMPTRSLSPRVAIATGLRTLLPILTRVLRRSATLSASVENRGFGRGLRYVEYQPLPAGELLLCWTLAAAAVSILIMKAVNALQFNGVIFIPAWRSLYDVMKVWI